MSDGVTVAMADPIPAYSCWPKVAKVVLLGVSLAVPLGACETIQREMGFNRSTQMGAAGGAAFGGIVAAIAGANPAWIAASVILGGVTGGIIGEKLDRNPGGTWRTV